MGVAIIAIFMLTLNVLTYFGEKILIFFFLLAAFLRKVYKCAKAVMEM
jgi:hypothetical protein